MLATIVASVALASVVPGAWALNFAASQNADLQLGAPAGGWTTKTQHSAANMAYGMYFPNGVAVDSSGSVYVADAGSSRIMRWGTTPATDGEAMTNVLMKADASQASWNQACTNNANRPEQLMSYGAGSLAVTDRYNSRIVIIPTEQTTDGATGTIFLGQPNGTSCSANRGGLGIPAANTLSQPSSVWTDGTKLAVADTGNHRVLLWDTFPATGQAADRVLGQADFASVLSNRGGTPAADTLANPKGVWFDGSWLYVADSSNHRVLAWNGWPATNGAAATNVIGQANMTSNATGCANNRMSYPTAVATTGSGAGHRLAINVQNQSRVVILNAWPTAPVDSPTFNSVLGHAGTANCTRNRSLAAASAGSLNFPDGIAFDGSGQLWVSDTTNNRVLRFPSLATGTAADRVLGHSNFTTTVPMDGIDDNVFQQLAGNTSATSQGTRVAMSAPGVLLAPEPGESAMRIWTTAPSTDNEAFAIRYGQALRERSGINGPGNNLSASSINEARGVWTDGTRVLLADTGNDRVLAWTSMPVSDTDAPDYVLGQPNFTTSSAATTQAGMDKPSDVASDGIDVFVADRDNDRVLVYRNFWLTPSNGPLADRVLGQANFTSGSSGLAADRINQPWGVTVDSRRRLVVADQNNNRLLVWNDHASITNGQAADAVIGQPNFTSNPSGTISEDANDVQLAGGGLLWTEDCRVRYLDPLPTSGSVLAATGQVGIGCSGQTVGQNRLDSPSGVSAAAGRVWVANAEHGRLMRWTDATTPTITAGPTATVRCDGTVTISWTTSESTTTEIRWDTVSRGSWAGGYANQNIDTSYTGLTHTYDLSFPTPGTRYVRVRAEDWNAQSVVSGEISFTVPPTCPAPTTMFADDANAQAGTGRANPSTTNTPPISSSAFHTSWTNVAGVTMDRQEQSTWTTPPEHGGGVWHFDNSGAPDANAQDAQTMTLAGGAGYAASGRFSQALQAGGGKRASVPHSANLTKASDFTIEAWVRSTDLTPAVWGFVAGKTDSNGCGSGTNCSYALEYDRAGDRMCFIVIRADTVERNVCGSNAATLANGQWHHVAGTMSATNVIRLYVDGVDVTGPLSVGDTMQQVPTAPLYVGATLGGTNPWSGEIDEVRFSPVAYDAAAILGYYRTRRPHLQQLHAQASTALGANCVTATRCEDQVYAGQADILRPGARYWQRTRFNTLTNDYWTDQGVDWFETVDTTNITISVGGSVALGSGLPGQDAFGTSTVQVTTNGAGGYQLLARDESDTWGLERLGGGPTIVDRQNGAVAPAAWPAGTAGFYGLTVRSATGNRLAKWGTAPGGFAESDVTNNLYTGLENTSDVLLHERTTYGLATDTVLVTWRANAAASQAAGSYDGVMTLTAVANP